MKILLTLASSLMLAATLSAAESATEFPNISIGELKTVIEAKTVTIIDVNGTESYKAGHIPGAIDFDASKGRLAKLLPKDKDALVVAYCGGPTCGAYREAANAAKKLGYKNVKHLSAGISGWKEAKEKTEKSS